MNFVKGELHTDFHLSILTISSLLCFPPPASSSGEDNIFLQNIPKIFLIYFASHHSHHPQVMMKYFSSKIFLKYILSTLLPTTHIVLRSGEDKSFTKSKLEVVFFGAKVFFVATYTFSMPDCDRKQY